MEEAWRERISAHKLAGSQSRPLNYARSVGVLCVQGILCRASEVCSVSERTEGRMHDYVNIAILLVLSARPRSTDEYLYLTSASDKENSCAQNALTGRDHEQTSPGAVRDIGCARH